jgi:hypothetical protein
MDERLEDLLRRVLATQAAHTFLIDTLLNLSFAEIPKGTRMQLVQALVDSSSKTEVLRGAAANDFEAERLADMVLQCQQQVRDALNRALQAADAMEEQMRRPR